MIIFDGISEFELSYLIGIGGEKRTGANPRPHTI